MTRPGLLPVCLLLFSFATAAAPFHAASLTISPAGSVRPASPMLEPRSGQTATLLPDGKVLIAGGMRRNQDFYRSAELYDPATGKFTFTGEMNVARVGQVAVLLRTCEVLIAGGWVGSGATDSAELYDPATGKFSLIGKMTVRRGGPSATLLPDGNVLIAGGSNSRGWNGNLSSAEIYDPRTGKFRPAASMSDSRFKLPDEAVQLPSGRLLIAGGSKEVEVFDTSSGKFLVATGQMNEPWHFMTETKLRDGSVLLAGGYPNNPEATAQAWIYRP